MQQNDESDSHAHLRLDSTECRKILLTANTGVMVLPPKIQSWTFRGQDTNLLVSIVSVMAGEFMQYDELYVYTEHSPYL